jgi:hypothetical protein
MTALPFYAGIASRGHMPSPGPLLCAHAKNAIYATHREFGTLRNIKDLYISLLALFDVVGTLRRMPTVPKDAKNCVWTPWHSSAFGNARIESTR